MIIEEEHSSSDSEPEQIVVRTVRKKKKPKAKKQPQIIYISDSGSDEDETDYYEPQPAQNEPTDPFAGLRFVLKKKMTLSLHRPTLVQRPVPSV